MLPQTRDCDMREMHLFVTYVVAKNVAVFSQSNVCVLQPPRHVMVFRVLLL